MATYNIDYSWNTVLAGFRRSIDWARNGVQPSGQHMRQLADLYNFLLGGRKKVLFEKSLRPVDLIAPTSDTVTWRWAGHTSPLTSSLHATYVTLPTTGATSALIAQAWIVAESGLTGTGTTTTFAPIFRTDEKAATIVPNDYGVADQDLTITADSDYRFYLHLQNGMRVMSLTVEENPRETIDPAVDTTAVDPSLFSVATFVHDVGVTDIFSAADKVWKRCGKVLFSWSATSAEGEVTRTSATAANLINQSVTAWGANNPGWPVVVQYAGSLDSDNVAVTFWCYARMDSAASGTVDFRVSGSTLATITVNSSTAQFWTATGNLNGANASDILQCLIAGSGTVELKVAAVGAFLHVA